MADANAAPRDLHSSQPGEQSLISCRDLMKLYRMGDQEVRALNGVSLDIQAGEFVAIMGPSGSGKSSLMNLIGALDRPTSGEMWINGKALSQMTRDELADLRNETLGFVFQQFNLLPRQDALANVKLPLRYARKDAVDADARARECLEMVGLGSRMDHRPMQLSGGQQQRVAIARALVNKPRILLADEPTGALDTKTTAEIMNLLSELNSQGITVILVTHEDEVAAYAKRQIFFRDGQIETDRLNDPQQTAHEHRPVLAGSSRT
jgi:putative ABC transport system ATP-binding protein